MQPLLEDPDVPPSGGHLWIDRREEAQRIVDLALSAGSSLVLLYGRRGIGKTSLVRGWALDLVPPPSTAFYGDCAGALPERVEAPSGEEADLWAAAARPGLIFLDSFETVLELPADVREPVLASLCARASAASTRAVLALVLNEDRLGDAFALRAYVPRILHAAFEIRGIEPGAELRSAVARDDLGYAPEVLEVLTAEARSLGVGAAAGLTPDLVKVVDFQLRRLLGKAGKTELGLAEYRASGGLQEILRGYLFSRLKELESTGGPDLDIGLAILDEAVVAARSRAPDLVDLCARVGVTRQEYESAIARLAEQGGLLLVREGVELQVTPSALSEVVSREVARRVLEALQAVRRGIEGWRELGALMPPESFAAVHARRRLLRLSPEQMDLLLRCAVRHDAADLGAARYWLARVDPERAVEVLSLLLADPLPEVRARSASLLAAFDEPGVRSQLHLAAIRDEEPQVRARAVDSLGHMASGVQREGLLQEAEDVRSPYREAAIDSLRICRTQRAVEVLRRIVEDPKSIAALRAKAIGVLAELEMVEAAAALVEIALVDDDGEDRDAAAGVLAGTRSEPLLAGALGALRTRAVVRGQLRQGWRAALKLALRVSASLLLVLANLGVHPLILLLLRRYRAGLALLAAEGASIALLWNGEGNLAVLGGLGLLLTLVTGLVAPMGSLLLGLRERRVRPGSLRSAMGATLFAFNTLFPLALPLFHGLGHAAVGRVRRALALFALELVALFLLWLTWARPQVFYITVGNLPEDLLYDALVSGYFVLGLVLFAATYLVDATGVLVQTLLYTRTIEIEERRRRLFERVLANPVAACWVLNRLAGPDAGEAAWARALLRRHGRWMEPRLLIGCLGAEDRRTRRWLVRSLAGRPADAVPRMREAWETAGEAERRRILAALARHPSEASVAALRALRPQLGVSDRLRARLAAWHFRFRVWPKSGIAAALAALPLFVLFCYEGYKSVDNYARSQVKILRSEGNLIGAQEGHSSRLRIGAARYLAEVFPEQALPELGYVLDRTMDETVKQAAADALVAVATHDLDHLSFERREELRRQASEALVQRLGTGADPQVRGRVLEGLVQAASSAPRVIDMQIAQALGMLLHDAGQSEGTRHAALDALEAGRAASVIAALVEEPYEVQGLAAGAGSDLEEALRLEALSALGTMGTWPAYQELLRMAASSKLSRPLRERAGREAEDPLRRWRTDLEQERYDAVLVDGAAFLAAGQAGGLDRARFPWSDFLVLCGRARGGLTQRGNPNSSNAHMERLEAIDYLEQARDSRTEPLPPDAALLLADLRIAEGNWLDHQGNEADARREWEKALAADLALPSSRRAELLLKLRRFEEARKEARTAIEQNPEDYVGFRLLRRAFHEMGRDGEAVAAFTELQRRHPQSLLPRFNLAVVYNDYLSTTDAMAYQRAYAELAGIPPGRLHPFIRAKLAEIALNSGRHREAVNAARQLIQGGALSDLQARQAVVLNLAFIAYAGLVLEGDGEPARIQLERLAGLYRDLPGDFQNIWEWSGVLHRLERMETLPRERREALIGLVGILSSRRSQGDADAVFARNRAALVLPGGRPAS